MSIDRIPLPRTEGALWLCAKRDVGPDPDAALANTGASTVVCLNPEPELAGGHLGHLGYPEYVRWLRSNAGERAEWFPIRNLGSESAETTMPLLDSIVTRLEAGRGVVMHCAMGQGRAGTIAACVLMRLGAPRDDALATVAANRAFAGPQGGDQWNLIDDVAHLLDAD